MVTFILKNRTVNRLVYEYYPEGDSEKLPGLISVWLKKSDVVLDVVAEDDFITFSISKEISELRDSIDEIYAELGMSPESDEWEDFEDDNDCYYYADVVINKIKNAMLRMEFPDNGIIV